MKPESIEWQSGSYWKCCDFNSFSSLASLCVSFHAPPLHSPNTLHLRLETYYCCFPFTYKRFKEFRAAHTKGNMNSILFFVRRKFRATLAWWQPSHDVHSVCQLILYDMSAIASLMANCCAHCFFIHFSCQSNRFKWNSYLFKLIFARSQRDRWTWRIHCAHRWAILVDSLMHSDIRMRSFLLAAVSNDHYLTAYKLIWNVCSIGKWNVRCLVWVWI